MLGLIVAGETEPSVLVELAQGRLQAKRALLEQALTGCFRPHHRFLLAEQFSHLDELEQAITRFGTEIQERLQADEELIALLDTVPGINRRVAEIVLAEIGTDLGRFPSAAHLASWAGLCPGNHQSAGKQLSGRTRKGSQWLRQALIEAAHGAGRTKQTYLGAQFRRLTSRRGKKKAVVAVAHRLLVIIFHVLTRKEPYRDLGPNYFDERERAAVERRTVRRLERLGYHVQLIAASTA